MKRRRTTSGVPGSLRSQSSRPDFGELVRLLGTAAEENNSGLCFDCHAIGVFCFARPVVVHHAASARVHCCCTAQNIPCMS